MAKEGLNIILEKHQKWLNNEEGGERADLYGANLRCDDLSCADLRFANLSDTYLRYANLSCANLNGANLRGADLRGANLDEKEQIRKGICLSHKMVGYKK